MSETIHANGDEMTPVIEHVLDAVHRAGAKEAEVYASKVHDFSVRGYEETTEWLRSAVARGIGVRVIKNGLTGYAYTSDLSRDGLAFVVDRAVANARHGVPDPSAGLPDTQGEIPELSGLVDPEFWQVTPDQKIEFLKTMASEAKRVGRSISVPRVHYGDEYRLVYVANSRGRFASYERTMAYGWLETIATDQEGKQTGHSYTVGRRPAQLELARAGREASESALSYLGARPAPAGRTTVVMAPMAAAIFLYHVSGLLSGSAVARRTTPFTGGSGQEVGTELLTVVDDPLHPEGVASRPFDDEGVPSRTTPLIEQGRLANILHNTQTARRAGTVSTGHARRNSYRSLPGVSPTNLLILPGQADPETLISQVESGIFIRDLAGWEATLPATGEFSAFMLGQRIEGGRLTEAVNQSAIVGRVQDLLKNLVAVGRDLRWVPIDCVVGAPTLLLEGVQVTGR